MGVKGKAWIMFFFIPFIPAYCLLANKGAGIQHANKPKSINALDPSLRWGGRT